MVVVVEFFRMRKGFCVNGPLLFLSFLLFVPFELVVVVGAVGTVGNSPAFFGEFSKRCGNGGKTLFVFPRFP
jgi:hypothetical protein